MTTINHQQVKNVGNSAIRLSQIFMDSGDFAEADELLQDAIESLEEQADRLREEQNTVARNKLELVEV